MDQKLTHDELYKKYLRSAYGPNLFPIVHVFLFILVFFVICLTLIMNMSVITNIETDTKLNTNKKSKNDIPIVEQQTLVEPTVKLI